MPAMQEVPAQVYDAVEDVLQQLHHLQTRRQRWLGAEIGTRELRRCDAHSKPGRQ